MKDLANSLSPGASFPATVKSPGLLDAVLSAKAIVKKNKTMIKMAENSEMLSQLNQLLEEALGLVLTVNSAILFEIEKFKVNAEILDEIQEIQEELQTEFPSLSENDPCPVAKNDGTKKNDNNVKSEAKGDLGKKAANVTLNYFDGVDDDDDEDGDCIYHRIQ